MIDLNKFKIVGSVKGHISTEEAFLDDGHCQFELYIEEGKKPNTSNVALTFEGAYYACTENLLRTQVSDIAWYQLGVAINRVMVEVRDYEERVDYLAQLLTLAAKMQATDLLQQKRLVDWEGFKFGNRKGDDYTIIAAQELLLSYAGSAAETFTDGAYTFGAQIQKDEEETIGKVQFFINTTNLEAMRTIISELDMSLASSWEDELESMLTGHVDTLRKLGWVE